MKGKFKLVSFALIAMFLVSCGNGNKESQTTPEQKADSTETVTSSEPTVVEEPAVEEPAVEEMVLTLKAAKDPCMGNEPDYLIIKGGKMLDDAAKPYKLDAKNAKNASVNFEKITKKDDGTVAVALSTMSNADDSVTVKIIVTDANGTEKTIDYVIPHCV